MDESMWRVSGEASLQAVLEGPACPPLLSRVVKGIHSWQIRNETTVGRTMQVSQLMPQWVAALLALGSTVTLEERDEQVPLEALVRGEVEGKVMTLQIPRSRNPGQGGHEMGWGEAHVARTPSDDPIVAAIAVVAWEDGVVKDARLTLTGVSSRPIWIADAVDTLRGKALEQARIDDVASAVEAEVDPPGDYLGSEVYRRAMAGVLSRRALQVCLDQEASDE